MLLRLVKNEYFQGIGVLSAACIFFLSWPILNYRDHIFSPVGLLQNNTLTRVTENPPWVNPYLGDVVYVIQPWLLYNRDSVHAGQLPLWNPYNGNGMPHLANFQSAVFSIFTLPFYVLDFKAAVLVSSFLALFGHGFFAFAFLKQVRLHQIAALIGAIAYMFGGYHVIWLGWLPLIGSGVALPAALFFTEAIFNRLNNSPPGRIFWLLAGFSASLLVGLLAGHPETFYAALLLTALYVFFRLLRWFKQLGWSKHSARSVLLVGGQFVVAALLVPLIASVQLLPFFEYLSHSTVSNPVQKAKVQLPLGILPLLVFPDLLGNPSASYRPTLETQLQLWNYPESSSFYVGGLVLALAILSLPLGRNSWHVCFFGITSALWLVYVFNLLSTRELFKLIPGASFVLPPRTYDIWLFSVSVSAALFVDYAHRTQLPKPNWVVAVLGIGMALLGAAWLLSVNLLNQFSEAVFRDSPAFVSHGLTHVAFVSAVLLVGVTLTACLFLGLSNWQRLFLSAALIGVVFLQGGYVFMGYNPISQEETFYPRTAVVQRLQNDVGRATLLILGEETIPPDVNMVYQLNLIPGYDGMWVRYQRRLYRVVFGVPAGAVAPVLKADVRALHIFGVEYVATTKPTLPIEISPGAALGGNHADKFELVWQESGVRLYRYTGSLTRYFTVDGAVVAADETQAWKTIRSAEFDPSRFVLLTADDSSLQAPIEQTQVGVARPAHVIADTGDYVQLKAMRDQPGYLVMAMTYYPGWKAKVNGKPQPVMRANYAFSAVALPAGESVVEFYYDPDSVKAGILLSGLGMLLSGVFIVKKGLRRRSPNLS